MITYRHILLALILLLGGLASATPQVEDAIEYDGKIYRIGRWFDGLPLERYFEDGHARPKVLKSPGSSCWRGYIACWKIAEGNLWLTQIIIYDDDSEFLPLRSVPEKILPLGTIFAGCGPAKQADWFTGDIELERKLIASKRIAGGLEETYSGKVLVLEKGVLKAVETRSVVLKRPDNPDPKALASRLGPPPLTHEGKAEQAGAGQPATRPESKSEGGDRPQPESEDRSR